MTLAEANSWIALIGALALTGVVAKMNRATCHGIRIAVVLLFAGLVADWLSLWLVGWGSWATTLEYVGIATFLIADRRHRLIAIPAIFRWNRT